MRRSADYQGWSNWDTWHTKLLMDNDQDLYNKSREIVDHGLDAGWSDEEVIKRLREWAMRKIVAPHNRDAMKDAQEWNDIPIEERIDPHYEDLKNKNPQAADLVDSLGFGANVEDTEPTLMRDDLINWDEILNSFKREREENEEYERQEEHKKTLTPYDIVHWNDERTRMMDAWLAYHGVDPHARSFGPDDERSRGVWGHQQWVPFDLIKQNVTEYHWPQGFGDQTAKQIEQEGGWNYRTRDLGEEAAIALQRGQAVPWQIEQMTNALTAKGYTPEDIQAIMRQRYKLVPNPDYPDQNMLVDMEKQPKLPDPSLDQPGDLTIPMDWHTSKTARTVPVELVGDNFFITQDDERVNIHNFDQFNPTAWNAYVPDEQQAPVGSVVYFPLTYEMLADMPSWQINEVPGIIGKVPVMWVEWIYVEPEYRDTNVFNALALQVKADADKAGLPIEAYYQNPQLQRVIERYFQRTAMDNWDEMLDPDWNYRDEPDYSKRRPFLVDFAESVDDPDPIVYIGDLGTFHGDRPRDWGLENHQHRYYGEIWEDTNPPRFVGAPPDRIYDEAAQAHAQRAYYNQENIQKRASDGADYWTQSQDDWWGTQNDSLFNVTVPGDAPGMPHEMITDSLHCPYCNGPMHGLECPTCGFKKEAADDHWKDEPRDKDGKWTGKRHPDSLKPIAVDKKGKGHHRVKLLKHTKGDTEVHWVRCHQCGHMTVVADDGELHTCTHCGNRIGFHDRDALLDSLEDHEDHKSSKLAAGFNPRGVKLLTNAGFQPHSVQEHAQTFSWLDPNGLEHRIPVSRNQDADRYVAQDLARCHSGKCYCAEQPWQADPATPLAPENVPIRANSQVAFQGQTWTVGEIVGDLVDLYNDWGEQEIAPMAELQLVSGLVPQDQIHVEPQTDRGISWDDAQWDSDTFLDHDMINEHLKTVAQGQQYMDYAKREKRRQDAEWPEMGLREAGWYDEVGGPCPRCGRGELVHGADIKGQRQEWCRHCGWTDRDEIKQQAVPKVGDYAKSRDGHPVQIMGLHTEDENLFATIKYLDGYMPYPSVGGRAGGTEEDPLWEHGVYDRKVVRPGGDYYNDKHWMIEPGLQLQQQETLPGLRQAAPSNRWMQAGQFYVFAKAGPNKGRWLFVSQDDNFEIWDAMDGKTMGKQNAMKRWPVVEWNELPPEAMKAIADQPYIPGRWHEDGTDGQMRIAADNVPGAPVSDSGHWVYLDGHVGMGGIHSDIAESLARDLGYDDSQVKYISNWIARGHCPSDMAMAVGTLKNNYPYIWNSTRDRNHVWDTVKQHVDGAPKRLSASR